METKYLQLQYWQVLLAASLILINGALSLVMQLGQEKRLLWATTRMVVQLLLIGLVLQYVFAVQNFFLIMAMMTVMVLIASQAALARTSRRYPGMQWNCLISIWLSSWLITGLTLTAILQVSPWYLPRYSIPFLGMILGNTLNGISLGLDRFTNEIADQRDQIDTMLALGASKWEAARGSIRESLRTGLVPIINGMMVAGVVSLPGMMTGQLMAGVDPIEAVKYQIVIMFLIASATALGTVGVVLLSYRKLFNKRHQFRYDLLSEKKST